MSQEVVLLNFQTKHCFRLKHELYSHRYKKKEIGTCQNSVIFLCVSAFFWALWIDCSWAFSCCRSLRDAESFSSTWLITAASLGEKKWEKEQREGEEKKNTSWEEKQNKREGGFGAQGLTALLTFHFSCSESQWAAGFLSPPGSSSRRSGRVER